VNNPKIVADLIRGFYRDEVNISDDKRMMDNMAKACNGCREGFDLCGAEVWNSLFYILCFGMDFDSIQKNMRAFRFWKDVFPVIIEQRAQFGTTIEKYNPDGEYGKDPDVARIMREVSDKNVRVMLSIIDKIRNDRSCRMMWGDNVYQDWKVLLGSDDVPSYKKAVLGFIHLYYLVNRYGIIIEDEDLEELKKDADEWMLEICLGVNSINFLKGLSEKMVNG
jgi:hypothetical protein